jgi:hypothetical protein
LLPTILLEAITVLPVPAGTSSWGSVKAIDR